MTRLSKFSILIPFALLVGMSSARAEKCFEEVTPPPTLDCANGANEKSADFTGDCHETNPQPVQVEIECPMTWYSVPRTSNLLSQKAFCSALGLKPANFDGAICAAGERRPSTDQAGASSINYWAGRWGSGGGEGGTTTQTRTISFGGGRDQPRETITTQYCWRSGKKDYDNTDVLVAYACQ